MFDIPGVTCFHNELWEQTNVFWSLAIMSYSGYWDLWKKWMENPLEDLETFRADQTGRLLEIGKRPKTPADIQGQFMGLVRFTPESWGWVEKTIRQPLSKPLNKLDITALLQELIQRDYRIQVISTDDLWLERDSEQDIMACEKYFGAEL